VTVGIPGLDLDGGDFGVGFVSSNARRKTLRLYVGGTITACTNGLITGEIVMKKRHTINLKLDDEIREGLNRYANSALRVNEQIAALADRALSTEKTDELLMAAGRLNLLPWSGIGKVDAEFREPTYADHAQRTSWGLLNAFTHIVKNIPPLRQMDRIDAFRALLPVVPAAA